MSKEKTIFPDTVSADVALQRYLEVNGKLNKKNKDILYLLSSHSKFIGRAALGDKGLVESVSERQQREGLCSSETISAQAIANQAGIRGTD